MTKDINNNVTKVIEDIIYCVTHKATLNSTNATTWNAVLDGSWNTTSWVIYDAIDFSSNFATSEYFT